jgi:hypothetical protein
MTTIAIAPTLMLSGCAALLAGNFADFEWTHRHDPLHDFRLTQFDVVFLGIGLVAFALAWMLARRRSGSHQRSALALIPLHAAMAVTGSVLNHVDVGAALIIGLALLIPVGLASSRAWDPERENDRA